MLGMGGKVCGWTDRLDNWVDGRGGWGRGGWIDGLVDRQMDRLVGG